MNFKLTKKWVWRLECQVLAEIACWIKSIFLSGMKIKCWCWKCNIEKKHLVNKTTRRKIVFKDWTGSYTKQSQNTLRRHQKGSRYEWYYFKRKTKLQKIETVAITFKVGMLHKRTVCDFVAHWQAAFLAWVKS